MPFDPKQLDLYPTDAGVYIMKNGKGEVIYVGKANSLQKRLKQYFVPGRDSRAMLPLLVSELVSIETVALSTEKEALLLENTFIKKYQPKFNVLLKDDKTYISLSINPKEAWPRLKLTRLKGKSSGDALHFGPYTSAVSAKQTFELMARLFPLRQCSDEEFKRRTRPCLLYSMKKCIAPCCGLCSKEEYDTYVGSAIRFLKGGSQGILDHLTKEMGKASESLEFERAGSLLRTIQQIKHVTQETTIFQKSQEKNVDVIGFYRQADQVLISLLVFREGTLINSSTFPFSHLIDEDEEILSSFILQHYSMENKALLPEEILTPLSLRNAQEIASVLKDFHPKAKTCALICPKKGNNKALLDLAEKNAQSSFQQKAEMRASKEKILSQLSELLPLNRYPKRIECFDTSNLSGSHLVASSVVFIDGEEDKKKMRLYHVKGIDKPDDYAALHQVLTRRLLRAKEEDDFPDLLIIDGGKGQLGIALDVLKELEIIHVDVVSLVKEKGRHDKGLTLEKICIPGKADPISLPAHSPILFFLQKVRDAAHKQAISFYRRTHEKKIVRSEIDSIQGIGPIKKKRLLQAFGSLSNILSQSEEELKKIEGITSKDIEQIKKISK
jgi:excinuclease ABC subunit C